MEQVSVPMGAALAVDLAAGALQPLLTDHQGGGSGVGEGGGQGRGLARPDCHHPRQGCHDQVLGLLAQRVWALL